MCQRLQNLLVKQKFDSAKLKQGGSNFVFLVAISRFSWAADTVVCATAGITLETSWQNKSSAVRRRQRRRRGGARANLGRHSYKVEIPPTQTKPAYSLASRQWMILKWRAIQCLWQRCEGRSGRKVSTVTSTPTCTEDLKEFLILRWTAVTLGSLLWRICWRP